MFGSAALVSVLLVLLGALAVWQFSMRFGPELGCISVRAGRVLVLRGALPASFVDDVADVVGRAGVARGTVRVLSDGPRARLVTDGIDEGTTQRLRNVLGIHPLPSLLRATPPRRRNFGQVIGSAELAWLLSGPRD